MGPMTAATAAGSAPSVRSVYADAVMPIAPKAPGRMIHSSAHANRNAGSGPNDSRTNTYTPPERGKAAASSEYVSAPHRTTMAPRTHASRNSGTTSMRWATLAGVRKMPLPIVEPTNTATALQSPRRRISRSPQRSAGIKGADMRFENIHFAAYDATLHDTRLVRRRVRLPAHHPRRRRAHHGIGAGVRRSLAAVQRPPVSAAGRHRNGDRVEPPARCRTGLDPSGGAGGVRLGVEPAVRPSDRPAVLHRSRAPHHPGATRRGHGVARAARVERRAAPGHGDVAACDIVGCGNW